MNENLDLTKILEGCPEGTEFYHTGYGRVWLTKIYPDAENIAYPIALSLREYNPHPILHNICVTAKGTIAYNFDGECALFPSKDQRDWSKFLRFWDKPKVEKFDVNTLKPFYKVLVRLDKNDYWIAAHFSHISDFTHKAVCDGFYYEYCIPYNKKTKHLIGTNADCPEYYKWWEE